MSVVCVSHSLSGRSLALRQDSYRNLRRVLLGVTCSGVRACVGRRFGARH